MFYCLCMSSGIEVLMYFFFIWMGAYRNVLIYYFELLIITLVMNSCVWVVLLLLQGLEVSFFSVVLLLCLIMDSIVTYVA